MILNQFLRVVENLSHKQAVLEEKWLWFSTCKCMSLDELGHISEKISKFYCDSFEVPKYKKGKEMT